MIQRLIATALLVLLPSLARATCPAGTDTYSASVCTLSPLLYWRMDEASGNLADESGNGRTGTAVGTATYSQSSTIVAGTAIKSTSTSNYFRRADEAAFDFGTGVFSAGCWMKESGGTSFGTYLGQVAGSPYHGWAIGSNGITSAPHIWFAQANPTLTCAVSGQCAFNLSIWSLVMFVRTGASGSNTGRIYGKCDGVPGNNCLDNASSFLGFNAGSYNVNNAADFEAFYAASGFSGGAPNVTLDECFLTNTDISASYFSLYDCGATGTGCAGSTAGPRRRIFQSRRDERFERLHIPSLIERGIPAFTVDEPAFRLGKLNARLVMGQYERRIR